MKIGILTFHRAINYGAVLQCYALYQTLSDKGHDVEVIDYRPESIEKYRLFFRLKDFVAKKRFLEKLKYVISCISLFKSKQLTNKKFDVFLCRYLKTTSIIKTYDEIPLDYDVIFWGSDQIWNPEICEGLDKVYYAQFPKNRALFVGYAVSLGRIELINNKTYAEQFGKYIRAYDSLSVRESNLQQFLFNKYGLNAQLVCDPSMLLNRNRYESMAVLPKVSNYVLLFTLEDNPHFSLFAKRIAEQLNTNVIMIGANMNPLRRYTFEKHSCLSPQEFLGYIKHAACIVTDSFHTTSFAVFMHKNFYVLKKKNNNSRLENILVFLQLESRFVEAEEMVSYRPVDWFGIDDRIETYKKESIDFIDNVLMRKKNV